MLGILVAYFECVVTFWRSLQEHEASHRSDTFQPLFQRVLELCGDGNEEIA